MLPIRTYIVEDSPLIRQQLIAALEELLPLDVIGHAEDEGGALGWLAGNGHRADLVIVDVFLKGGSGLGVLRALRARPPGSRLVVLSNYATTEMRRLCLELGADRVFDKSHEIDALLHYCASLP